MTAAALRSNFAANRLVYALVVMAIALVTLVALLESRRSDAQVASATIMVPPARAAALGGRGRRAARARRQRGGTC